jgi:hypothetical protein
VSDHEITHKEIYERVVRLEEKVDRIDGNTSGLVKAFEAANGAFLVLEWVARLAKPILWIGAALTAISIAWSNFKLK